MKMAESVMSLLSSVSGKRDKKLNKALACFIAHENNQHAISELVEHLYHKDKNIQSDCIETIYETGYLKPSLLANYYPEFLALLSCPNNRLIWGAMTALTTIVDIRHAEIFKSLNIISQTVDKGSVITIDCGIIIYARLTRYNDYFDITNPLLMEQLKKCPIKQLPMYAEKSIDCISDKNATEFTSIIQARMTECERESQKSRLLKVLRKVS